MAKAIDLIISDPVKRANLEKRFWPKVKVAGQNDCWEWIASRRDKGYGQISAKLNGKSVSLKAHRVSFALANGQIENDLSVCHRCDNPRCVNPKHLFSGTCKVNSQDSVKKGRASRPPEHSGEHHHKNKFSEADAISILNDNRLRKVIAKEYGVAPCTISAIKTGRNWKKLKRVSDR